MIHRGENQDMQHLQREYEDALLKISPADFEKLAIEVEKEGKNVYDCVKQYLERTLWNGLSI